MIAFIEYSDDPHDEPHVDYVDMSLSKRAAIAMKRGLRHVAPGRYWNAMKRHGSHDVNAVPSIEWIFVYPPCVSYQYDDLFHRTTFHDVDLINMKDNIMDKKSFNSMVSIFQSRYQLDSNEQAIGMLTMFPNRTIADWDNIISSSHCSNPSSVIDSELFSNIGLICHH